MRLLYILYSMLIVSLLGACSQRVSISVSCEKDQKDNYYLKWEMYPDRDGVPIDIYMSDNDSIFPSSPIRTVSSDQYMVLIADTTVNKSRKYFKLKVQNACSGVVTNRFFQLDSIPNFRDIGGYYTNDNRKIRWGKVYRSGLLSKRSKRDDYELDRLRIKTILDIQSSDVKDMTGVDNYFRIPIGKESYESVTEQVVDGRFMRGDAIIFSQDLYKDMVENYTDHFAQFFSCFLDESNYPIAYNCYLGKDQSGVATYLLLRALDVSEAGAEKDYLLSNLGINKLKIVQGVDSLTESMQEALTMITHTDLAVLKYAVYCMRKKSGSVDNYMTKELKLTPDKRRKLREILLY